MRQKTGKVPQSFSVLTAAYFAILLSIYLLYPGRGGYQTITAQKWSVYLLITGVYIAAMLLLHLELAIVGAARLPAPTMLRKTLGLPQKFILLYLFATVLSTLFSEFRQPADDARDWPRSPCIVSVSSSCPPTGSRSAGCCGCTPPRSASTACSACSSLRG